MVANRIGDAMVSVLTASVVDRGLEHRLDQPKNYKRDICCFSAKHTALSCFSAKHTALRSKSED